MELALIVNPAAHRDISSADIASRDIPHQRPAPLLHYSAHA